MGDAKSGMAFHCGPPCNQYVTVSTTWTKKRGQQDYGLQPGLMKLHLGLNGTLI